MTERSPRSEVGILQSGYVHGQGCAAAESGRFVDCTCNLSDVNAYPNCWVCRNEVDRLLKKLDAVKRAAS